MEKKYDKNEVQQNINKLDDVGCLIFGLSCIERLFGNYAEFVKENNWGSTKELRQIIDLLWSIVDSDFVIDNYNVLRNKCESLMPNTEDFQTVLVSSALDASSAVLIILDYLVDNTNSNIVDITSLCIDTVDMYVQELLNLKIDDPKIEIKILQHELMQAELKKQKEEIEKLIQYSKTKQKKDTFLSEFKGPKKSNLGF